MVLLLTLDGVCREVSKESNYLDDSRSKDLLRHLFHICKMQPHKPSKGVLISFQASVFVVWVNKSCSLCDQPFLAQALSFVDKAAVSLCVSYLNMCNYQKTTVPNTLSTTIKRLQCQTPCQQLSKDYNAKRLVNNYQKTTVPNTLSATIKRLQCQTPCQQLSKDYNAKHLVSNIWLVTVITDKA